MNKLIYISAIILGLAFVSCTKQEIVPVSDNTQDVPVWEVQQTILHDDGDTHNIDGSVSPADDGSRNGDITDPNNDPDGKAQN
ncbi:MAG: hypothetical protein COA33_014190 [Fluviicola sp.]|nr:hypothetical protein [Fluviicola sp.]